MGLRIVPEEKQKQKDLRLSDLDAGEWFREGGGALGIKKDNYSFRWVARADGSTENLNPETIQFGDHYSIAKRLGFPKFEVTED